MQERSLLKDFKWKTKLSNTVQTLKECFSSLILTPLIASSFCEANPWSQ